MELCPSSLVAILEKTYPTPPSPPVLKTLLLHTSNALAYIHSLHFCHRDIKVENVMVTTTSPLTFKLTDFGSAVPEATFMTRTKGDTGRIEEDIEKFTTPDYRAPEMVRLYDNLPIGTPADVWALGCLLYKAVAFVTPFDGSPMKIMRGAYEKPAHCPPSFEYFIGRCLVVDQHQRSSAHELLKEAQTHFTFSGSSCSVQTAAPKPGLEDIFQSLDTFAKQKRSASTTFDFATSAFD